MVICGDPEFADDRKIIKNPILIVEVLSPSSRTESGKCFYASVKGLENTVTLVSIGYELPLAEVYEQMTFDDAERS
jgi:hypothetical protein